MPTAIEVFDRYKNSPEQALTVLLPVLHMFRQHHDTCRKDGFVMNPDIRSYLTDALSRTETIGVPATDSSSTEAAFIAKNACVALAKLWDANPVDVGDVKAAAPSAEFEAILTVNDDPHFEGWKNGQPLQHMYDKSFWEIARKAQVERDAQSRVALLSSIVVGAEVTLTIPDGAPVRVNTVAEGSPVDGFVCDDGTRIKFNEVGGGRWMVEPRERSQRQDFFSTATEARPTIPSDKKMIAAIRGLLRDDMTEKEPDRLPWPKTEFVAKTGFWNRNTRMGNGGGRPNTSILTAEVLKDADYGTLFAYMTRRFGPPCIRSDDHYKDMTGAWCLTTPLPDMWVMVSPSLSGMDFSFRIHMTRDAEAPLRALKEDYCRKEGDGEAEAYLSVLAPRTRALRGFFLDLLRPVWVRDVPMNVEGRLDDDNPVCDWEEDDNHPDGGEHGYGVPYAESSTYALQETVMSARGALDRLLTAAWNLAPGDYGRAMTQAAETLEKLALENTSDSENKDDGNIPTPGR